MSPHIRFPPHKIYKVPVKGGVAVRKMRDRRYVTLDTEHMRRLHQEAIEQLELMRTALETAEQASGTMRDYPRENRLRDHWNGYMDVIHMVSATITRWPT